MHVCDGYTTDFRFPRRGHDKTTGELSNAGFGGGIIEDKGVVALVNYSIIINRAKRASETGVEEGCDEAKKLSKGLETQVNGKVWGPVVPASESFEELRLHEVVAKALTNFRVLRVTAGLKDAATKEAAKVDKRAAKAAKATAAGAARDARRVTEVMEVVGAASDASVAPVIVPPSPAASSRRAPWPSVSLLGKVYSLRSSGGGFVALGVVRGEVDLSDLDVREMKKCLCQCVADEEVDQEQSKDFGAGH